MTLHSSGNETGETIPKRIAILVEPSPFTYVSGYKNRFCNTIKHLVEAGCEVMVVTTGTRTNILLLENWVDCLGRGLTWPGVDSSALQDAPENFHGAQVVSSYSFGFPFYPQLPLTFGLSPRIYKKLASFKPDIIHCSTPGFLVFAAWMYAKLLRVPMVLSYHTHVPQYALRYGLALLVPLLWALIRLMHTAAQLTLLTSTVLQAEFRNEKAAPDASLQVRHHGDTVEHCGVEHLEVMLDVFGLSGCGISVWGFMIVFCNQMGYFLCVLEAGV